MTCLLTSREACQVSDSFLSTLYGQEAFTRWKSLKRVLNFITEQEYVNWLLDVAHHYCSAEIDINTDVCVAGTDLAPHANIPPEEHALKPTTSPPASSIKREQAVVTVKAQQAHDPGPADSSDCDAASFLLDHVRADSIGDVIGEVSLSHDSINSNSENTYEHLSLTDSSQRYVDAVSTSDEDVSNLDGFNSQDIPGTLALPGQPLHRTYPCQYCTYSAHNRAALNRHHQSVHQRLKPHNCPHCDYHCARKDNLKHHLIQRHRYASKYTCEQCGKPFVNQLSLSSHLNICQTKVNSD